MLKNYTKLNNPNYLLQVHEIKDNIIFEWQLINKWTQVRTYKKTKKNNYKGMLVKHIKNR